jgi:hypothetical protein
MIAPPHALSVAKVWVLEWSVVKGLALQLVAVHVGAARLAMTQLPLVNLPPLRPRPGLTDFRARGVVWVLEQRAVKASVLQLVAAQVVVVNLDVLQTREGLVDSRARAFDELLARGRAGLGKQLSR